MHRKRSHCFSILYADRIIEIRTLEDDNSRLNRRFSILYADRIIEICFGGATIVTAINVSVSSMRIELLKSHA